MSVWASLDGIDCLFCKRGCKECGHVGNPYAYESSATLPNRRSPRGGWIGIALLSKYVRYYRRYPHGTNPPKGVEPWLRLSVNDSDVILDRVQVDRLAAQLRWWLDTVDAT